MLGIHHNWLLHEFYYCHIFVLLIKQLKNTNMNKALLVGINKYADAPLNGCINDITDMAKHLVEHCAFSKQEIRLLVDERATKRNILERLKWLITGARKGDMLFFQYSGHGTQLATRDEIGEVDGMDEAVVPFDFNWDDVSTFITDNEFNNLFRQVPEGVTFIWVSDSCHSGGLTRQLKNRSFVAKEPNNSARFLIPPADINWRVETANAAHINARAFSKPVSNINVGLISGCASHQTSADAYFNGRYNGALTYHLLQTLNSEKTHRKSLQQIVIEVRRRLLKEGFPQVPQSEGNIKVLKGAFLSAKTISPQRKPTKAKRKAKTNVVKKHIPQQKLITKK